jgi:hypothetical protein
VNYESGESCMGYFLHHAITVTSWNEELVNKAHEKAKEVFSTVSEITEPVTNKFRAFFIPPDGSKEGWEESDICDKRRAYFMNWCAEQSYEDGSTSLKAVEYYFGGDAGESGIVRTT